LAQEINFAMALTTNYSDTNLYSTTVTNKLDTVAAFELFFKENFEALHNYAFSILKDEVMAEEMVQNVFCKLWEKKEQLNKIASAKAYLYRAVHNESLNYLKHLKVRAGYEKFAKTTNNTNDDASVQLAHNELAEKLQGALNELPEQCRTIFQLSRFEELKYREIAQELGLSVKTIENQMGKALKILRTKLADFLPSLLILLAHIVN
jgi:RNA polymerase sigma-70 factor (ECF subfamily)